MNEGNPAASSRAAAMASTIPPPAFFENFSQPAHEKVLVQLQAPPVANKATSLKIPTTFGELSVAEMVALEMNIPAPIVQMTMAYQLLQHGTRFENATQLFLAAEDLLNNPEKQAGVAKTLYKAQQAQKEERGVESSKDQAKREERGVESSKDQAKREEREVKIHAPEEDRGQIPREKRRHSGSLHTADALVGNVSDPGRPNNVGDVLEGGEPVDNKAQLKERVMSLARENHRLRQRQLCCKCKKVKLTSNAVTFLPCGHFITCKDCADSVNNCPSCGKEIMGTVKTFLS